jgi:hypothetical protein
MPDPPKIFYGEAQETVGDPVHDPANVEVLTGHGESVVSQADADRLALEDLDRQMADHAAHTQAKLAAEEARATPEVREQIARDNDEVETNEFLARHPEFWKCEENRKRMVDTVNNMGQGYNVASLEAAYERVKDFLISGESGKTNAQLMAEQAEAEREARLRPRRANIPQPSGPSPEQIERQQAEALRVEDLKVIAEWEALPLETQKRYVRNNRRACQRYEEAKNRILPRRKF